MKSLFPVACGLAFGAALSQPSPLAAQTAGPSKHAGISRMLQSDLAAIPSGSPPTDAQKQALSADLGRLFRQVNSPPTVTLDYVADKLAGIAAQSQVLSGDLAALVPEITGTATGSYLSDNVRVANLETNLVKAGVGEIDAQQLTAGVRVLSYSTLSFTTGDTRNAHPLPVDPTAQGYKNSHLSTVELDSFVGPETAQGVVTNPYSLSQGVTVELSQVPLGKYRVSVLTNSSSQPVELGSIRVHPGFLYKGGDHPRHPRSGAASFGDFGPGRSLPDGLSVNDIATLILTNEQGIPVMSAEFTAADPSQLTLTHSARGPLTTTTVAPAAGGSVDAVDVKDGLSENGSLLLSAVGLPANATLMLSVNGAVVAPITTGPTGNLFVKTSEAVFPRPPKSTEVVNLLPATVDLFTATSFAVSDAQGNVLLSAGPT